VTNQPSSVGAAFTKPRIDNGIVKLSLYRDCVVIRGYGFPSSLLQVLHCLLDTRYVVPMRIAAVAYSVANLAKLLAAGGPLRLAKEKARLEDVPEFVYELEQEACVFVGEEVGDILRPHVGQGLIFVSPPRCRVTNLALPPWTKLGTKFDVR
jgi:hypothetical protein